MGKNSFKGIESVSYLAPYQGCLERSCVNNSNPYARIERIEARLRGEAYTPHRHDTYALGLTLTGVQTFAYRGCKHFSIPGNLIVLHPDEVHDGAAGTDEALIYRMIYLPPELISAAFDFRRSLPFVKEPVFTDIELWSALSEFLSDLNAPPSELLLDDTIMRIGLGLARHERQPFRLLGRVASRAVLQARDLLESEFDKPVPSAKLEAATGLDRYELCRNFRRLFGTSPHRYLVQRRLDHAKKAILGGASLASAAADSGFSDQSHLTRHFRSSFGISPGRWLTVQSRWDIQR